MRNHHYSIILTLGLIFFIAACSMGILPERSALDSMQTGEQQLKQTSLPALASTPAVETPPIVLQTSPQVGEEQPLETPIEIVFDQPMDRNSVERAFAIEPGASVDGVFEWVNDQTVRFSPDEGFVRGQRYRIRLVETAESQTGLSLSQPFELRFSAVGFLEVTNIQPADGSSEILPDTVVTVLFNRPVVSLSSIADAASRPDPLTFTPPVRGEGEWINTSIYQFTPAGEGFAPATDYTARIAKGLTDVEGNAVLEDDVEWRFSTVTPQVVASLPAGGDIYISPSPTIELAFNQPMNRASVERRFRLVNSVSGEAISGGFSWDEGGLSQPTGQDDFDGYYDYEYDEGEGPQTVGVETLIFTPDETLEFGTVYQIELPQETLGSLGSAEMQRDFNAVFTVTPRPAVVSTYPTDGAKAVEAWQSLQISFNAPIDPDSVVIGQNLVIEPTVAVTRVYTYWWSSNTNLEINFPTQASSEYKVTLRPGIKGRYGQRLSKATSVSWQTRAASPMLFMHSQGRIASYNAYTDTLAYLTVRNLSEVSLALYRLPLEDFLRLNSSNWWLVWDEYRGDPQSGNLLSRWQKKVNPELNQNAIYRIDLGRESGLGNRLPPGLYYLEAFAEAEHVYPAAKGSDGEYDLFSERKMLVVSHNNLTFKASTGEALSWLTDLQSGQPVAGAPVVVMAATDAESEPENLGLASTDRDGLALVDYERRSDSFESRVVIAGDPDEADQNFAVTVSNWSDGIERYQFDNVSTEDYVQPYNALLYTDRTIYRPGQTVNFKGIIRVDDDASYSLPTANRTVNIIISDSQGKEIYNEDIRLSRQGTVNGSFDLDQNAGLGFYSIQATYDETNYFYDDFQVAAYRTPEFLVSVETDRPEYSQGEKIRVTASAEFFFGGPVSQAEVRWTLLTSDYNFQYSGSGFYDFTEYDASRQGVFFSSFGESVAEGTGVTDDDGHFTFEVEADIADKITSQRFTIDLVVTDINNQETASQAEVIVHKGLFYVGLRPERYVNTAKQESQVNLLIVDWESQPVPNQEVEIIFAEHNWYSVQRQDESGSFYWDSVVENIPVFTTTATTNQDGQAVASFRPDQGGIYHISARATDQDENVVRASTFMWVSGSEYVNWRQENNDRLELVADQREYNVGDTATILVPHPYSGTVQALVTLERGHVYDYFVTELETNSEQLEIPITGEMVPNMYVSVVVVKGVDEFNALPSFKVGYASLPINTEEKELQITLTPDKSPEAKYQPGETVTYFVDVTNNEGQPIQAELSLALVDKAVLSLSPETPGQLMDTFWRNRGLGVQTAGGLTLAIDRINLSVAPEAKGGGGGFDEGFGVIRGDFKDTALWLADFVTNKDGQGIVEVELPDNLTRWTMTGKGVTGAETLVGEQRVDIVSTKPLLVRPVAPRFFVVGDEARMGLIVQNNTDESLEVEARFEAEGLEIGNWRLEGDPWHEADEATALTVGAGERVKVEYNVSVEDVQMINLTMGAKSDEYGDALAFELPVYRFSTPETVATAGIIADDGVRAEAVALPRSFDPTQGDLTVNIDPSLAAGMRAGLTYLEHFRYECTEQTVSRFLPNIFTFRAYKQLALENPELETKLPGLVSVGLQRLYNQQHFDGGWGWFVRDESDPFLTAYVLLGLVEARRAEFGVDDQVISNAVDYLEASLMTPKDVDVAWKANRQAFILYVLAEAGQGDLGRSVVLFEERQKLDTFGRAYLALAIHLLDEQAKQIDTLLSDITDAAIVSATGAHWEETQVDYYAMNTDTRSSAIIISVLSRIQPDHPLLPNAVRWLMSIREHGGHWETTQETAWAIIGLTDWMITSGELEGRYTWTVSLNGETLGNGVVEQANIDQTTKLQVEVRDLLADAVNRLAISRDPVGSTVDGSAGQLYYTAYLTYYRPTPEVKALDRGIIISRQYSLADSESDKPITEANVGDIIKVKLTLVAPNDLHYVLVEDPFPAGAEGVDTSLATTSIVGQPPELERTDRRNPWGGGYGWWYFSHSELRDEKAVLFATFLPKGTYEYSYQIRASLPGEYNVIPTHAEQMYFPEVFGRGDGGLFRIN